MKKGFTLIELLVVIAIIIILAALVISRVSSASRDAKNARTKSDLNSMVRAINVAKSKTGKTLSEIWRPYASTHSDFHPTDARWRCSASNRANPDLRNIPDSDPCAQDMTIAWDLIYEAAGIGISGRPPRDAWGSPYLIDGNENESNYYDNLWCITTSPPYAGTNHDLVKSVGEDGINHNDRSHDDVYADILPDKIVCP